MATPGAPRPSIRQVYPADETATHASSKLRDGKCLPSLGWEILAWNGILSTSTWILRIKESTSCKTANRYYGGLVYEAVILASRGFPSLFAHFRPPLLLLLPFVFSRSPREGMGSLEDERERKRRVIAAERSNGVKIITPLNEIMASWDRFCCWFFFLLGRERERRVRGFGVRLRASNREENFYFCSRFCFNSRCRKQ